MLKNMTASVFSLKLSEVHYYCAVLMNWFLFLPENFVQEAQIPEIYDKMLPHYYQVKHKFESLLKWENW